MNKLIAQAPGRINIIGEHTDYNDGYVLPGAIDKNTTVVLSRNGTMNTCNCIAKDLDEKYQFDLNTYGRLESGWQNYVMGVVKELQKLGAWINGFDCEISSTVPIGSGMSSSAALECSLAFGLNELFDLDLSPIQMIKASQMAEHNFVGIKCGIMDQFASMMGKEDQVIRLDCRTLAYEYFPLELGRYELVLLNTNVAHSLASSEYNKRRSTCEEGVEIIQTRFPKVINLRDVSVDQLSQVKTIMPPLVYNRCAHVIEENQRVLKATRAMKDNQLIELGKLIFASHYSLRDLYEVSCSELDFLVGLAEEHTDVIGARMMGGGFGGCTLNLVRSNQIESFIEQAAESYHLKFDNNLTPYRVKLSDGAGLVN